MYLPVAPVDLEEAGYLAHDASLSDAPAPARTPSTATPRDRDRLLGLGARHLGQRLAVFDRHDLAELRQVLRPVVEDLAARGASRCSARGAR